MRRILYYTDFKKVKFAEEAITSYFSKTIKDLVCEENPTVLENLT